jgi:hypothetical protein
MKVTTLVEDGPGCVTMLKRWWSAVDIELKAPRKVSHVSTL